MPDFFHHKSELFPYSISILEAGNWYNTFASNLKTPFYGTYTSSIALCL